MAGGKLPAGATAVRGLGPAEAAAEKGEAGRSQRTGRNPTKGGLGTDSESVSAEGSDSEKRKKTSSESGVLDTEVGAGPPEATAGEVEASGAGGKEESIPVLV